MSNNECVGGYLGRQPEYWEKSGRLGREAFAHFFEAIGRSNTEKVEILKQVFPNAFTMIEVMLGVLK